MKELIMNPGTLKLNGRSRLTIVFHKEKEIPQRDSGILDTLLLKKNIRLVWYIIGRKELKPNEENLKAIKT